jgi:hypothetical protein
MSGRGFGSTVFSTGSTGGFFVRANQNFTDTNRGTRVSVEGTADNTSTRLEIARFLSIASAVNYLAFKNSATGSGLTVEAAGTDTNIDLNLTPKGSGTVVVPKLRLTTSPTNGHVLTSDGSGNATWQAAPGGGSGITRSILTVATNTAFAASALTDYVYFLNSASTFTMPTAVSNTNRYTLKNIHSADVTIGTTGSETIDGTTTITIAPEDSVDLVSDNTNWRVI